MDARSQPGGTYTRTPPRRRRRRPSVWRKAVWPLFKATVFLAVAVFVASAVVSKIARPFRLRDSEGRETRRIAQQVAQLKSDNETLGRQINYLKTPQGAAEAARKYGYVKPGERTLILPAEPKK